MANANLTSEVKDILSRATAHQNVIILPEGQLDRKLYEAVNKALTNAGGKWKRGIGHVFTSDAAQKLAAMLSTGVSVDEKKRDQAFFTPPDLAASVAAMAEIRAGHTVLEPSAGRGALADACAAAGADEVHCFEINREYVDELLSKEYRVTHGDFLRFMASQRYDRIVMNPPFTKNQDIAHVKHALTWLRRGGILVALMLNNQTRKGFVDLNVEYEPEIDEIDRGAFKEAGTDISTLILKIET